MGKTEGENIHASWFNPRNGETTLIGEYENRGTRTFNPPKEFEEGNDWVLVLESL